MLRNSRVLTCACRGAALVGLLLCFAAGTTAESDLSEEHEEALRSRVEARWTALATNDLHAAYELMSPAYRAVFTEEMYRGQSSAMLERELTSVEILNYDASAAVASVAAGVMSRPAKQTSAAAAIISAQPITVVEQWILRNNQWWFSVNK